MSGGGQDSGEESEVGDAKTTITVELLDWRQFVAGSGRGLKTLEGGEHSREECEVGGGKNHGTKSNCWIGTTAVDGSVGRRRSLR